jgi:hypothetical protein
MPQRGAALIVSYVKMTSMTSDHRPLGNVIDYVMYFQRHCSIPIYPVHVLRGLT